MRRRRLALRQIAEATQHVSDIDDDDDGGSEHESGDRDDKPPTFSLLTVTTAPGAARPDSVIELSDSDESIRGAVTDTTERSNEHKQHPQPLGHTAQTATAAPLRKESPTKQHQASNECAAVDPTSASSIFRLYQEGLAPDQVLQLAFTRRRDIAIDTLFPTDAALEPPVSIESGHSDRDAALASAKQYLHCPDNATFTHRQSWRALSERDWHDLYQTDARPTAATLNALLRDVASDALVQFVWDALLPVVLAHDDSAEQHELLTRLVQHQSLRTLAPAAFRAKVRAMALPTRLGDAARGAALERQLLALYHRSRMHSQL